MKVVTVVGTRPEIIRLSRVMTALDRDTEHIIVHTGQNYDYELNQVFFEDMDLRAPDHFLSAAGANAAETIGRIIAASDRVFEEVKPDAVLVLGDTNSCLSALSAKRRKIPVFHMEAGNRCFDDRVPEEINRRIVDHISDINLPYSAISREYLLREGIAPDRIIKTGSPMYEVLHHYLPKVRASHALEVLKLTECEYFVVSCHREENVDSVHRLREFVEVLNYLAEQYGFPVIVSTHPRTRKRLAESQLSLMPEVRLLPPFGFLDYVRLQMSAKVTLSDSGTISEESSILSFPAVNLREAHERPEAMEEAAVMMVGFSLTRLGEALNVLDRQGSQAALPVKDYQASRVSEKIVRIIHSYVDYVNRTVWQTSHLQGR